MTSANYAVIGAETVVSSRGKVCGLHARVGCRKLAAIFSCEDCKKSPALKVVGGGGVGRSRRVM